MQEPFDNELSLQFVYGADGGPPRRGKMSVTACDLGALFKRVTEQIPPSGFIESGEAGEPVTSWLKIEEA